MGVVQNLQIEWSEQRLQGNCMMQHESAPPETLASSHLILNEFLVVPYLETLLLKICYYPYSVIRFHVEVLTTCKERDIEEVIVMILFLLMSFID